MLVNKVVETENGSVTFQGELSDVELDYVLQVGLNVLLQQGAISKTSGVEPNTTELPQ